MDWLNYLLLLCNNVGYVMVVEKFIGIDVIDWCKYVWMIVCEVVCIVDYFIVIVVGVLELGVFMFMFYGM